MTRKQTIGAVSFFIAYTLLLLWLFWPDVVGAAPLAKDKFVKLGCTPNAEEENVEGYRIYWKVGDQPWHTERSVKFYRWQSEGTPKLLWLKDPDDGHVDLEFHLTSALAALETDTMYQFAATAFRGDEESGLSQDKPFWASAKALEITALGLDE